MSTPPGGVPTVDGVRLFVADPSGDQWRELTEGAEPPVRVSAPDLAAARRARTRIRAGDDVAVILDVSVALADDYRAAIRALGPAAQLASVQYTGTVDGLAGLVADIESAGVADGVTLIPALPGLDAATVGRDVLRRLALRSHRAAS
jgi:hypothetical protein